MESCPTDAFEVLLLRSPPEACDGPKEEGYGNVRVQCISVCDSVLLKFAALSGRGLPKYFDPYKHTSHKQTPPPAKRPPILAVLEPMVYATLT